MAEGTRNKEVLEACKRTELMLAQERGKREEGEKNTQVKLEEIVRAQGGLQSAMVVMQQQLQIIANQLQTMNRGESILGELPAMSNNERGSTSHQEHPRGNFGSMETSGSIIGINTLHKLEFPKFDGDNPRMWVRRCERYFQILSTIAEEHKVPLASIHLEGEAEMWFQGYNEGRDGLGWQDFVQAVINRFDGTSPEMVVGRFNKLQQHRTIAQYTDDEVSMEKFTEMEVNEVVTKVFDKIHVTKFEKLKEVRRRVEVFNKMLFKGIRELRIIGIEKLNVKEGNTKRWNRMLGKTSFLYKCGRVELSFIIDPGGSIACKLKLMLRNAFCFKKIIQQIINGNHGFARKIRFTQMMHVRRYEIAKIFGNVELSNHKYGVLLCALSCTIFKNIMDVEGEVEIMKRMTKHPNIVTLKHTYEDDSALHIVMLCEGSELLDRIVARCHYTEEELQVVLGSKVDARAMLCSYVRWGRWGRHKAMLSFYSAIQKRGIIFSVADFNFMMSSWPRKSLQIDEKKYATMADYGTPGRVLYRIPVKALTSCGKYDKVEEAIRNSFHENLELDTVIYNTYIKAILEAGKLWFAISIYERMLPSNNSPSAQIYNTMISVYGRARNLVKVVEMFNMAQRMSVSLDGKTYKNVICYYGKFGKVDEASTIFSKMQKEGIKLG